MERTIELPSGGFVGKCQHCEGRCENRTLDVCSSCFRDQVAQVLKPEEIGRPWTVVEAQRARAAYIREWKAVHGSLAREAVDAKWKALFLKCDPQNRHGLPLDSEFEEPKPLLDLTEYKLRKSIVVDTTRAKMELVVSNLLDDIRADRVEGFVFAADMKEGHARVEAGGQMSCASALWLGQMIINKVGPS